VQRLSRFNRNYSLTVEVTGNQTITVAPPLRVAFDAVKSISGGLNKLTIRIYNLKQSNRLALVKDAEQRKRIPLAFSVGYQDQLQLLFKGTVHRGQNYRDGADIITELECLDGGFDWLNSFTSKTVRGKTKAVDAILADMPNTTRGKLTEQTPLLRPKVLVGASGKLIDDMLADDETWYIDDERLYIIKQGEVPSGYIPVVSAETGLRDTPVREQSKVTFNTLMNPTIKIGGLCQLISAQAPHLNGIYKVDTIGYSGDYEGSDWTQTVTALVISGYSVL